MLKKYRDELKKLYKEHEGLKIKLLTMINHPLTPIEFEVAWSELLTEYGIGENDAIKSIWESRHLWVSAYLKPLYCGRMTSTQRSESVNKAVKKRGFAMRKTCMSKFARRMLEFIQHTNHISAGETHCSQAENFRVTLQPFDKQLSRVYTRAVFKKYRETYIYSTAFRIDPEEGKANSYLITSIPAKYVLKRYSRDARFFVMWDRHDIVTMGPNYTTEQSRTTKLVELAMTAVRACCRSSTRFDRGCDDLAALATWAEAIPGDSGPSRVVEHENNQNVENETREGSRAPQIANDSQISDYAPKEVRTKGRKRGAQQIDNGDEG
ncbi:protein FAR-RED IMPAIRED RESPONSE 1-like [Panicum virgatum]|uniref:protein FAR-RED IMPAIRED RESPONSE 1-like n=1 Tax=Panicum virgatum TaxID=38727 RepID=UPI0019D5C9ED|nr:protein FAR-RED IMPAIRED RESPONSE 1-like [Panicum virgatum]